MLVNAKCPNCGATLKVDKEKDCAICEHCGTPFIIEKAINNYNVTNVINGNVTYKGTKSYEALQQEARLAIDKFEHSKDRNMLSQMDSIGTQLISIKKDSFVGNFILFYSTWKYRNYGLVRIEQLDVLLSDLLNNAVKSIKNQEQFDYVKTFLSNSCYSLGFDFNYYRIIYSSNFDLCKAVFEDFVKRQLKENVDTYEKQQLIFNRLKEFAEQIGLANTEIHELICHKIKKAKSKNRNIAILLFSIIGLFAIGFVTVLIVLYAR